MFCDGRRGCEKMGGETLFFIFYDGRFKGNEFVLLLVGLKLERREKFSEVRFVGF